MRRVKEILAEVSGIPEAYILDAMTLRYDLGISGWEIAEPMRASFEKIDEMLLFDPAATVHSVEKSVE